MQRNQNDSYFCNDFTVGIEGVLFVTAARTMEWLTMTINDYDNANE